MCEFVCICVCMCVVMGAVCTSCSFVPLVLSLLVASIARVFAASTSCLWMYFTYTGPVSRVQFQYAGDSGAAVTVFIVSRGARKGQESEARSGHRAGVCGVEDDSWKLLSNFAARISAGYRDDLGCDVHSKRDVWLTKERRWSAASSLMRWPDFSQQQVIGSVFWMVARDLKRTFGGCGVD